MSPEGGRDRASLVDASGMMARTAARRVPVSAPPRFQGYLDERSTHHVSGWVRNLSDPSDRLEFELVLPASDAHAGIQGGAAERVVYRGRADAYSHVLTQVGVGDGCYAFHVVFPEPLTEVERDRLVARPAGARWTLELAPALKTVFEPISHVAMDIVNNCNLRCPFCVYDYSNTRRTKLMLEETFLSALRLLPFVTDGNFWLSCLHEPTLHPKLLDFIALVPRPYRRKLYYTTNLAKRQPPEYFDAIARSDMHHLNISFESLDPAVYERLRDGARHHIFAANWELLLRAYADAEAPPPLRYNIMAYRSNLREIPRLVQTLLADKRAWQVEIRHTYDVPSIPAEFRKTEFLTTEEWAWLADQLGGVPKDRLVLLLPPGGVGYSNDGGAWSKAGRKTSDAGDDSDPGDFQVPRPFEISMDWDGGLRVYGERPRGPGQPPVHVNYVMTNIRSVKDPLRFLLAL